MVDMNSMKPMEDDPNVVSPVLSQPTVWEGDLPPARPHGGSDPVWWEPCSNLMKAPGEWHLIRKGLMYQIRPAASNLKNRKVRFPPGHFEFIARFNPEFPDTTSKMILLGRYLGPDEPPRPEKKPRNSKTALVDAETHVGDVVPEMAEEPERAKMPTQDHDVPEFVDMEIPDPADDGDPPVFTGFDDPALIDEDD